LASFFFFLIPQHKKKIAPISCSLYLKEQPLILKGLEVFPVFFGNKHLKVPHRSERKAPLPLRNKVILN
jgi:hypothetical protein